MKQNQSTQKRQTNSFVDFVGLHREPAHSRSSFSAKVGNVRITLPSVRRSSRYRMVPFIGRFLLYFAGFSLLLWGLYGGSIVLAHRGGGLDIINCLLAVFGGSFLVFLANHDQAVSRKASLNNKKS